MAQKRTSPSPVPAPRQAKTRVVCGTCIKGSAGRNFLGVAAAFGHPGAGAAAERVAVAGSSESGWWWCKQTRALIACVSTRVVASSLLPCSRTSGTRVCALSELVVY